MKWNLLKSSNCCCWGPSLVCYKAACVFSLPPPVSHDSFHLLLSAISVFSFSLLYSGWLCASFSSVPFLALQDFPFLLVEGCCSGWVWSAAPPASCFRNVCPLYFSLYSFSVADKRSDQEWMFDFWNKRAEITAAVSQCADWCLMSWRVTALWSSDSCSRSWQPYRLFLSFHSHTQLSLPRCWAGFGILLSRNAMKLHANLVSVGRRKENPPIMLHTETCWQLECERLQVQPGKWELWNAFPKH